jgi:hypothetical protein
MADPTVTQAPADEGGFLAPKPGSKPVDHCFRCGKPTAPGVGLCDKHNPTHLAGPSSTQMHATIFGGIVVGVIGLFLILRLVSVETGPYATEVTGSVLEPGGGLALSFVVANEGDSSGVADCRVTRDGVVRPDDLAFRTTALQGGETMLIKKSLPEPPVDSIAYSPDKISVNCS